MIRPLAAAFSFLTRLPTVPRDLRPAEIGRSIAFFPAAGLFLGAAATLTATLPAAPTLVAIIIVALGAYLTGGLHLDGIADVADGLGGGRGDRARTLAIMRDSRIGAFGAIALALFLLAKVHATAAVLSARWPLLVAPVVARAVASALIVTFPYARPDGLGRIFHAEGRIHHAVFALALTTPLIYLSNLWLASALATLAALALAIHVARRLGGLTGDVYGACIETAELAFLLGTAC